MKVGILSDIHANLEALEVALARMAEEGVAYYTCLGDLVGYGADPNACIERIRTLTDSVIVGNHDHAALGLTDISYFNWHAREAVLWTRAVLIPEHRDYLNTLPLIRTYGQVLLVHATPSDPPAWDYLLSPFEAEEEFVALGEATICFIGHSHRPVTFVQDGQDCGVMFDREIKLLEGQKYIVNVGSVGQPRDGDPRLALCIYDTDQQIIRIERYQYDIGKAQRKIIKAGLPAFEAERLALGQ